MTYCLGMLLNEGMIMMADTRTNAGVDNFSSFKKLHTLANEPDRQIFACTSGSLSMSQTVISLISEGMPTAEGGKMMRTLAGTTTMFRAAQLVGEAVQQANRTVGSALSATKIPTTVSLILGGRIGDAPPSLFHIYGEGNFIECKAETPYIQVGETKYGKPIIDRSLRIDTPLAEAVKIGFLSYDSAMRSNLGVARPLDILVMPRDPAKPLVQRRIDADDAYFNDLSRRWSEALHAARQSIPNPPFIAD
jgi:putative proteasome-type protease